MASKPWHHAKQSRHERGYGSKWVATRKIIIARDCGLCQPCIRKGRPTPFDAVDHIIAKAQGGTDDLENLQLVCESCHAEKTQREALEAQGKTLKPRATFDENGRIVW